MMKVYFFEFLLRLLSTLFAHNNQTFLAESLRFLSRKQLLAFEESNGACRALVEHYASTLPLHLINPWPAFEEDGGKRLFPTCFEILHTAKEADIRSHVPPPFIRFGIYELEVGLANHNEVVIVVVVVVIDGVGIKDLQGQRIPNKLGEESGRRRG